jgi:hypothetical protein
MTQTVTRVHGSDTQVGIIYNLNANLYIITVKNTSTTALDLSLEDSYNGNAVIGGVIEAIVAEINPLAWFVPADQTTYAGQIHVVMDKAINDATELRTRIRRIGLKADLTTTVGPNNRDISGTTVTAAVSFMVA